MLILAVALSGAGCRSGLDTSYGRLRGSSLNGTGVLAELFRREGHQVRAAVRLNEEVADGSDVIVRVAPGPGPIAEDEADWYAWWLDGAWGRRLIYVVRDYDAEPEYWSAVLATRSDDIDPRQRERIEARRETARSWPDRLPPEPEEPADPDEWFGVEPAQGPPVVCEQLGGPWAEGIDPEAARIPRRGSLRVTVENVLLKGDGQTLAMEWELYGDRKVLILANSSFLLNGALLNAERRPLALRVVNWVGHDEPLRITFVEGPFLFIEPGGPSVFALLGVWPFGWLVAHFGLLGLAACLARAARLGRPKPEPPSGADRPAAHAEALGTLIARTHDTQTARAILESYRRWRAASPVTANLAARVPTHESPRN